MHVEGWDGVVSVSDRSANDPSRRTGPHSGQDVAVTKASVISKPSNACSTAVPSKTQHVGSTPSTTSSPAVM